MSVVVYHYTARSTEGRFVSGSLQADTYDQALAHLRMRALFVTSLERCGSAPATALSLLGLLPLDTRARVGFFRSFATLIASGVTMRRALEVAIAQCRDPRFAEALRSVASDIEEGSSLSAAMGRRPGEFSTLFVAMIRAGEIAGALHEVLERLATMLERDRALRKRVAAALAYPVIVAGASIALVVFLIANTVPAFAGMFEGMHVELPLSTRVLIALGNALHGMHLWLCAGLLSALAIAVAVVVKRSPPLLRVWDRVRVALPIVGRIARNATIAGLARTLGTLLHSGIPLLTALDATRDVVDNALYRDCIGEIEESLRSGDPIATPIERSALFDPLFTQLIHVGEETGALDAMLLRLAEYYELDVETALAALGSVLEPVLIVFLGAMVGVIVSSILVPLYSIIGSIR